MIIIHQFNKIKLKIFILIKNIYNHLDNYQNMKMIYIKLRSNKVSRITIIKI